MAREGAAQGRETETGPEEGDKVELGTAAAMGKRMWGGQGRGSTEALYRFFESHM
jgi:hypothetical protein